MASKALGFEQRQHFQSEITLGGVRCSSLRRRERNEKAGGKKEKFHAQQMELSGKRLTSFYLHFRLIDDCGLDEQKVPSQFLDAALRCSPFHVDQFDDRKAPWPVVRLRRHDHPSIR